MAWFVVFLLLLVRAVGRGGPAYRRFLDWSREPWMLALNVVALAFVVFHAITWFNLAPQAMVVRGARQAGAAVPGSLVAHYAAWAVVSALVAWLDRGVRSWRNSESNPLLWLLFSAGGLVAALLLPVLLLLFGLAVPAGLGASRPSTRTCSPWCATR